MALPLNTVASSENEYRRIGFEPGFDGIRGVGAVFVITAHCYMILLPEFNRLPEVVPGTFVFMDAFFVLSGFLITSLLLKEQLDQGRVSLLGYYRRRALRLLPALATLLVVHSVYASIVGSSRGYDMGIQRRTVLAALTFRLNFEMDNLLTAPVSKGLTQLWSLSMEEQFYVIWPWIVVALIPLTRRLRLVVPILAGGILAIALWRIHLWVQGEDWLRLYTHSDTRADSLLLGALLSHLWVRRKTPVRGLPVIAWCAVGFLAWAVANLNVDGDFAPLGGYNLLALSWAAILLAALDGRWWLCKVLTTAPLLALGKVSYGLYLWHLPIQFAVADHGRSLPVVVKLLIASVLTLGATYLSWTFVERPAIALKNRLRARSRKSESAVAPSIQSTLVD